MKMEPVAERIQLALDHAGLSWSGASVGIGLSAQAASKWKKGQIGRETLQKLSALTGVNSGWLLDGTGEMLVVGDKTKLDNNIDLTKKVFLDGRPVPVISWVAAGSFSPTEVVIKDAEVEEWLPPNKKCGSNGYGLIVTGVSMSPKFEMNDRIYVNPDIQTFDLQTDDLVIVSCSGDTEATFKCLIIEGGNTYLKPLNPNWPEQIIKLTEDCRLVGKVVGLYRDI
nr:S24 family peptidase [Acinetobacter pullicarnis]